MSDIVVGGKLDRYRLDELLGRNGVASVFKAVDTDSGATVAVKVPHLQFEADAEFAERFRREEELGRRLDHPNLVRVLSPPHKSQPYVVMEYVHGESLRDLLNRTPRLPAAKAVAIALQLSEAVAYLHGHGIVHRNLRPEKIVLADNGQVKVLDLGIALDQAARRVTWGGLASAIGVSGYLAPEQLRGLRGDARTDVFALGAILYEMLSGNPPFGDPEKLLSASTPDRPASLRRLGVDPALEAVIFKCVERAPADRYESAADLLRDLRHPPPPSAAVTRPMRHWIAAALVAGAVLALLALVIATS
jgi:eukaryotic-like serine/threonine-protein kinase